MTDDAKCYAATPAATLEQHITDSRVPKNEAEWWAYHEIGRLREENARYKLAYAEYVEATDRMNGTPCEQIRHQQEVEALREENARLATLSAKASLEASQLEERNKKLNADLLKQAELTAVTMTRCADLMPAQSAIVKLAEQQREIAQLQNDIEYLKYKVLSLSDALMPFANSADWKYGKYVWDTPIVAGINKDDLQINLTLKDFRMAQMLIEKIDEEINKRKPK